MARFAIAIVSSIMREVASSNTLDRKLGECLLYSQNSNLKEDLREILWVYLYCYPVCIFINSINQ